MPASLQIDADETDVQVRMQLITPVSLQRDTNVSRLAPRPHPSVVFRMLADSAVLFSTESEAYFGLNEVAARIWELLPPTCETLDEIIERLAAVYTEVDRDRIRVDTLALLGELQDAGLVIARDGAANGQSVERAD